VYVVDGLVAAKAGKKMPGVKMLHQASENNNKPEFVMGHFWGALSMLTQVGSRLFAVPLRLSIQDGVKSSPSQKDTLITRMHQLVASTARVAGAVLADCQYACRPFIEGLLRAGFHLIARVRMTTVAFEPAPKVSKRKRGSAEEVRQESSAPETLCAQGVVSKCGGGVVRTQAAGAAA
jgi:hypothetical protein